VTGVESKLLTGSGSTKAPISRPASWLLTEEQQYEHPIFSPPLLEGLKTSQVTKKYFLLGGTARKHPLSLPTLPPQASDTQETRGLRRSLGLTTWNQRR
jgi:hypothetical protein